MRWSTLHPFADPALLTQAMTHPSYTTEHPGVPTNQRMELLGDAVLQLIVSELLLERYPDWTEGQISKARAALVDRKSCAAIAEDLGMRAALRTERGLVIVARSKVMADAFEAWVAAIYQDAGLEACRAVLLPLLPNDVAADDLRDPKSALQELCQAQSRPLPTYADSFTGPDHDRRYAVHVTVDGVTYGPGIGTRKRTAEVEAARMALRGLGG